MASLTILIGLLAMAVAIAYYRIAAARKEEQAKGGARRLPGPKGYPILGSVPELPARNSWLKFEEWGQKYGPIYQVNLAGTNHVFIMRDRIAHDLLAKRSATYSDRPFIPALEQDNRTSGQYLPLMSKNDKWARQRRFAKQIMDTSHKASFYDYPELESIRLLVELMTDPSRYNIAMESFIARVTSRLAWGTSTPSDELKQRARELLVGVSPTGAIGNKLPFLMSLPEKLIPAKAWESRRSRTERKFFETMQQHVQADISKPMPSTQQSWTRMFLERKGHWGFANDLEGANAVGMHGIAGALTIAAPMQSFCLAMCHYPQYQPILHEEIDRVLGERMPTFSDMPDMPVLRAFIRETLRWRPPVPSGIPHESVKDDVYEGYFIPAGSVMHPTEWSIGRDPEVFTDPDAWNPLRWLDSTFPTYQEPLSKYPSITGYSQFGYGRRICTGQGVTEADLFVGLGSVAWLFSMGTDCEDAGVEVETTPAVKLDAEPMAMDQSPASSRRESWGSTSITSFADSAYATSSPRDVSSKNPFDGLELGEANQRLTMHINDSAISMPGTFDDAQFDGLEPNTADIKFPVAPGTTTIRRSSSRETPVVARTAHAAATQTAADDPTMDFSTLLIAKPMPFKFAMRIRSQARAEQVSKKWLDLKMKGEFADSRVFWAGGRDHRGDAQHGWGDIFA